MTLGTFGSTLNDELNRLANGGTYRDMDDMVDEALAAKQWANRENINPYSTDTVGILNEIAGLGLDKRNWLDFNGVCNYIAGTTGLPAAAALRQVYATTDLLTGVASYYVDGYAGTSYIPTTASGYMYLPGVTGNGASTPDASVLDITGDIDLRCKVALDNWIPSVNQALIVKWNASTNNRSYMLEIATDGTIAINTSTNGGSTLTVNSTVPTGIADGATKWVRATLDVNNGASGRDYAFYLSDDGTTWTQLGTTVTLGATTNIFSGNSPLEIGNRAGAPTGLARGKFYRAQVLNGIGGTTVFDANFETAMTSQTVTSFTESSSNAATVTINRTTYNFQLDTINNLGAAGSLLPTTLGSSTAADSNDPRFLDFTGTNYVYLPGVTGNYLSVPDAAALDITGDLDLRVQLAMDDWTPNGSSTPIAKWNGTTNQRSFALDINTNGTLTLNTSSNGSSITASATSTVATGITDGATKWIRATLDADNGASGYDIKFFLSDNGTTWTQLGTTVTGVGTASIFNSTTDVSIGCTLSPGNIIAGKVFRAQIFDGIDGTKVLDVDTSVITAGSATSFTAVTGQTVTINRSTSGRKTVAVTQPTWLFGTDDYMEVNNRYMSSGTYLYLPGVASNFASAPDSAALDITGDIDLRCKVALDDWTPAAVSRFICKRSTENSYDFYINTNGTLSLYWTTNGADATGITRTSTAAPIVADGATLWVRVTLDVDNGASGNDTIFYTSTDGTNWTQLGTTVTGAGTTSIFSGNSQLGIGAFSSGTSSPARGKFFRAQVRNGIDGTVAFDANFETSITSLNQASFTESSANAATVTINRSGSTFRSAGITTAGYLYPGATNTFAASAVDDLNFGAAESFTALIVARQWATVAATSQLVNKKAAITVGEPGWAIYNSSNTERRSIYGDGVIQPNALSTAGAVGTLETITGVRNVATDTISVYVNTSSGSSTDTTTLSGSTINTMRIGRFTSGATGYSDAEIYAVAVFRQALTARQITQISNYFARREAYL